MFPFSRKSSSIPRASLLSARPTRLVEAAIVPTENGGAKITVPLKPRRVHRWLLKFPDHANKTFELDPIGLFVWTTCDGKTSVQHLITKVARHLSISPREAEVATLTFLQTLTRKGLIGLEVRDAKKTSRQ